jgi:dolichyl-diphosphooligosaccharide--protein glycosyltransferase
LGRFDTDSFIPIFIFILSYLVYEFVNQQDKIKKLIFFLIYLVVSVFFMMWWQPAKYLSVPCFIIPYSLSYFFYDSEKWEKKLKIFLMGIAVLGAILVFFDIQMIFPEYINNVISDLKSHIKLVEKTDAGIFADVGKSIAELLPVDFKTISNDIIGDPFMLCFFFAGFYLMLKRHYKILIFLVFPFVLSLFMFLANRFAIFFLPFYALSVAYCLCYIFNMKYIQKLSLLKQYAVILSIFILVFIINSYRTISVRPLPVVTQYDIKIARSISEKASKDAVVWALWDYGYFLQYYAERKTFIDGGSQNPKKVFLSSLPLSVNDIHLSANLMKFFAAHDAGGLMQVYAATGDNLEKAVSFLAKTLSKKGDLKNVFNEYKINYDESWEKFLFPAPEVYLFLNSQYLEKAYWWNYFATYRNDKKEGTHPFTARIDLNRSLFDVNKGLINIDSNVYSIKELNNYVFKPTPGTATSQIYSNEDRLSMFIARGDNQAYLMDYLFSKNTFVKLFFFTPIIHNNAFRTIAYAPLEVGVWKVE